MSVDVLLDTNVLLWLAQGDPRASNAQKALNDPACTVTVSAVSLAEIAIKHSIGRLPESVGDIRTALRTFDIPELPFDGNHAEALAILPRHHRDPFDRMLIAQAQAEQYTIATSDREFSLYDVRLLT